MELSIRGALIAATTREYGAFKDEKGQELPGGTTYRLFIATGFEDEPTEVRSKKDAFEAAKVLGQGAVLDLVVTPRASNNRVALSLVSLRPADSAGAKRAA
jgi:hypothetical protein